MSSPRFLLGFLLFIACLINLISVNSDGKHIALFVFGDSVYDPGNNNYLNMSIQDKAVYWPYGETFFGFPTGRFCDGRIIPDFIAMDAKLPLWKPYLEPGSQQFTNGANFAASGAGVLPETNPGLINLRLQLSFFKKVASQLRQELGEEEGKKMLMEAVYLFSIGGNDITYFAGNYPNATESEQEQFLQVVIDNLTEVIKEIYEMGGRKLAFQNVGPMGCLPLAKQVNGISGDECVESLSEMARQLNNALLKAAQVLENQLEGFKYSVFDYYTSLYDIIKNPSKYGFQVADVACCGYGSNNASHCGIEPYYVCNNPSEYVFFDGAHPCESANILFAELLWNGEPEITKPYNMKQLFELDSDYPSETLHSIMNGGQIRR
ncbi:hypothetical protein P3X46_011241 [Hevea brasiliensis]|uniref:GDSL esterase/lipase 1-like n=1 Tax=Hevea brasiliensis TaxID=3981 RepID=A0ABQ9MKN3_HEVBR|nr:GDSL lipase-like [Hevea brasiliensis]KAJ9179454.1 hypothetical protein P3X46_011241 [Hevea brasiliensis]